MFDKALSLLELELNQTVSDSPYLIEMFITNVECINFIGNVRVFLIDDVIDFIHMFNLCLNK